MKDPEFCLCPRGLAHLSAAPSQPAGDAYARVELLSPDLHLHLHLDLDRFELLFHVFYFRSCDPRRQFPECRLDACLSGSHSRPTLDRELPRASGPIS